MPRTRDPNRDKAKKIYFESAGKIKLKDIADQLGIPEGTVRGWKNKDHWDDELKGTLQKNMERSKRKSQKKNIQDRITEEDIEGADLTEKQRLFCLYYIKSFNATQAAIKAGYSPDSAHVEGSRLLRNAKIAAEIKRLKGEMQEELFIDAIDVLKRYIKIAFADMTDFVDFGTKEIPVIDKETGEQMLDNEGNPVTRTISYLEFKNSNKVDGGLICEISQGKQGMKIKLEDRQKALDKLAEYFDLFPDKWKRKIEEEKLKLAARKAGEEDEDDKDDGFIEALKGEVSEVWSDDEE